jgi:vitamin B12 transporter
VINNTCSTLLLGLALVVTHDARAQTPVEQPTVVVSATRSAQTVDAALASVTVIDRAEIEASQAPDLLELLRQVPGVDISRPGGPGQSTSFLLRGTNSNHVLVLIDGVRVASANTGAFAFEHIDLEQVERIEIVRGPRAGYWGSDAIGGVMHIFTRRAAGASAVLRAGRYSTFEGATGYAARGERGGFGVTLGARRSEGFSAQNERGFAFDPDDDGYRNRTLGMHADYALGTQTLSAHALATRADTEFDIGKSELRNHVLGLALSGALTTRWSHELGFGSAREDLTTPDFFSLFHTRRETVDWLHRVNFGAQVNWVAGLNYIHESGENRDTFSGAPVYRATRSNRAWFTGVDAHGAHWDAEAALRHDDSSTFGGHTTAQLAAGWRPAEDWRAVLSFGQGFRAPNLNELYSPGFDGLFAGNPALDPERSRSVELGLSWQHSERQRSSAQAYRTRVRDLIAFEGGDTFQAVNLRQADIEGVELQHRYRAEHWDATASLIYLDAEDADTGLALLRRPRRKLGLDAHWQPADRWTLGMSAQWVDERRDFTAQLERYTLLDVSASRTINQNWLVQARLGNVFDRDYALADGFNTPGRNLMFTVRYRQTP